MNKAVHAEWFSLLLGLLGLVEEVIVIAQQGLPKGIQTTGNRENITFSSNNFVSKSWLWKVKKTTKY